MIFGSKFQNYMSGFGISILEILCAPIFTQNWQLRIFWPKLAQKWILGSEFQKSKSGFEINYSQIARVLSFSQNRQFLVFQPKFGEIAQLRARLWFKYYWGCCRELGGGWNELGGDWNELGGDRWRWLELGGGGWSRVAVSARFSNTHFNEHFLQNKGLWFYFVIVKETLKTNNLL